MLGVLEGIQLLLTNVKYMWIIHWMIKAGAPGVEAREGGRVQNRRDGKRGRESVGGGRPPRKKLTK